MTTQTVVPIVRNLRGLQLINAARDLIAAPDLMAEKTGLEGAHYDQSQPGNPDHRCGAAACALGWMAFLAGVWDGMSASTYADKEIGQLVGLYEDETRDLYCGFWDRWGVPAPERGSLLNRTNEEAVRVLDRLIAEQEAKQLQS